MIRSDYLLRLIELLGVFIKRASGKLSSGDLEQANKYLDQACRETVGMPLVVVEGTMADQLIKLLSPGGHTDLFKVMACGALLDLRAQSAYRNANETRAYHWWLKSLELLVVASSSHHKDVRQLTIDRLDSVVTSLQYFELPSAVCRLLAEAYEGQGRFAKAEDYWFDSGEGEAVEVFYQRLLQLSDGELELGRLPRIEILEALDELRSGEL